MEVLISTNLSNLSSRHISKDKNLRIRIYFLSKRIKFVATRKYINQAKGKEGIEVYGRKLKLM